MVGTRVFVGNLPSDTSERDLERFFRGYGRMREVLLKNGYGFVEFDDYRDAEDAVYELNGKKLLGIRITVERARGTPRGRDQYYARDRDYSGGGGGGGRGGGGEYRPRADRYGPPTRTAYRLIVENLSSRVSWQDLKDYMRQAGEVTYADAHKKRRNEGVVEFASSSDMRNALDKLDNTEINGRKIKLIEDKRHSSRSSSYSSRSRSRSPRKSRSTSRSRSPVKKSKSRSVSRKKSVERSRSNSRVKSSRDISRSRSKDRSTSRRPKSADRSRSRSLKRDSRSRSPKRETRSRSPKRDSRSPSRNRSHSKSRSRSRSHDN